MVMREKKENGEESRVGRRRGKREKEEEEKKVAFLFLARFSRLSLLSSFLFSRFFPPL
jgi:hypothetical protein